MSPPNDTPSPPTDHKFPLKQLTILAICRLAEPIAFMSVIAYIYVYTRDIRHTEDNAAFYSGLLVSAFAVAEVMTAMQWGLISDKYGRKPIVLFALAGTAVSNLIFGFATNYWVALLSRFVGGLLNGNVAVMQTMVAEMCKKPEHEPAAYSVIPFVWSVGSIMGAAMGGYLARPSETWPWLFPADGIFGKFPYLLPNLVSVAYLIFAVILGTAFLEETNEKAVSIFTRKARPQEVSNERTPLLSNSGTTAYNDEGQSKTGRRASFIAPSGPITSGTTVDIRRLSTITTKDDKPFIVTDGAGTAEEGVIEEEEEEAETPNRYSTEMVLLIIQVTVMSYHSMSYASLLPIFLVDEPQHKHLDLRGGLGYSLRDVGNYMAINGLIAMFIQIAVFPPFVQRVGVWKSFFWLVLFCPLAYLFIPFLTAMSHATVPWGIYADLTLQNFFVIILYPCLLILLKNATPSMSMLGQVNGLAMACCSGARTVAPPLIGAVYSNGGSAAGWWTVTAFAVVPGCLVCFMKRPQQQTGEDIAGHS